jgi:type II secretory pathway component PulF
MAIYIYTAKSRPDQTVKGEIEAESEQEVVYKLNKMGYFPVTIHGQNLLLEKDSALPLRKVPAREIALFTSQLSTLIKSGINILNSLNIIAGQISHKYLKAVINDVVAKVKDGQPLSKSLSSHPRVFSSLYTSLVNSGEVSGTLEATLERLAGFLEKEEALKSTIRASLTYPFFILVVGIGTVGVLLGFVIPRLVHMFQDMGQVLPLPTRILIAVSGALRSYWWIVLILAGCALFIFKRFLKSSQGKAAWDAFKLKVPLWGQIILKSEISRMMRTLSLLFSGGISIVASLDVAESVAGNQILKGHVHSLSKDIGAGSSLSGSLKKSKLFPDLVTHMITVGEDAGSLEQTFLRIAEEYDREVDRTLQAFTRLLEPAIILVMGLLVGFIVLSMLLPIFQINLIAR